MAELSDLTAQCIRCGFCLESCPTFVESGEEAESPRGRIYLIRSAVEGDFSWKDGVAPHLDGCLGCRACETACPSGVKYGEILELARDRIEQERPERAKKALLDLTSKPGLFSLSTKLPGKIPGFVSRLLSPQAPTAAKPVVQTTHPWPEMRDLPEVRGVVVLWQGCAMRVLFPNVHEATRRLLRRVGFVTDVADPGCCGALHAHNGYLAEGKSMLRQSLAMVPEGIPIVVNSAGCGSWMKDAAPDHPIFDIAEFLFNEGLVDRLKESKGVAAAVTYHDACHLAHGQGIRSQPRALLNAVPGLVLNELVESEHCCGSAGIYNLTQPTMAKRLLDRKWKNIQDSKAQIVVLGNPGCHAWIAQAAKGSNVEVLHTAELLERAFGA